MTEATQMGAESDPVDRVAAILEAEDPQETTEEVVETTEEVEVEAKADTEEVTSEDDAEDVIDTVELDAEALASMFGLDPSQIAIDENGGLSFKTKVDGEEGSATLADLVKSYQLESHVNKKSMELANQRKAFEVQTQQAQQAIGVQLQQSNYLLQTAEAQLLNEFNSIDWGALEHSDPGQAALLKQNYGARNAEIQQLKQQAIATAQQQQAQLSQAQQQNHQKYLGSQMVALVDALPSWANESVADAGKAKVIDWALKEGYSPQEISAIGNHKFILNALELMELRALRDGAVAAEKKVKKVLKPVQKPGARKSKAETSDEQLRTLRTQARKSGSVSDMAAYLEQII